MHVNRQESFSSSAMLLFWPVDLQNVSKWFGLQIYSTCLSATWPIAGGLSANQRLERSASRWATWFHGEAY